MTKHPQELADNLMKACPRLVRNVESKVGMKLVDFLGRRALPECRRAIAVLVRELDGIGWHPEQIADSIGSTRKAVDMALAPPEVSP